MFINSSLEQSGRFVKTNKKSFEFEKIESRNILLKICLI
jgi:hypothetical protein